MKTATCLFAMVLSVGFLYGTTIQVPGDAATIQGGINLVGAGDTVLVGPGTYVENIDFSGKDIVVQSTDGALATIIDGNQISSVVKFVNAETRIAVLDGFTITNGAGMAGTSAPRLGGGIVCRPLASPTLRNLVIRNNNALGEGSAGGGLASSTEAHPLLENVEIRDNESYYGGGISVYAADVTLCNVTIADNRASGEGGGIQMNLSECSANCLLMNGNYGGRGGGAVWVHGNSKIICIAATIVDNWAGHEFKGGAILATDNSDVILVNSILWQNYPNEIVSYTGSFAPNRIFLSHCLVGGYPGTLGLTDGEIKDSVALKTLDPSFVDFEDQDYHLANTSTCIDAGTQLYTHPTSGDTILSISASGFEGDAPDLGTYEYCGVLSAEDVFALPNSINLAPCFPNPFNPGTRLSFSIDQAEFVSLRVYDALGSEVATLINDRMPAGNYDLRFDAIDRSGNSMPTGLYFARLQAGEFAQTRKLLFLK